MSAKTVFFLSYTNVKKNQDCCIWFSQEMVGVDWLSVYVCDFLWVFLFSPAFQDGDRLETLN